MQLTHRPEYKAPWRSLGPNSVFIERWDQQGVNDCFAEHTICYPDVEFVKGKLSIVDRSFVNIGAVFIEPILGEGGVHEAPLAFLKEIRKLTSDFDVPLIFDEIQSGMGRTGTFFAADKFDVYADYYTISKSLGGGLAKIGALLINKDRYIPEFGFAHTSTFADDDFSSEIGLAALDLLTRDDCLLMKQCKRRGEYLIAKIKELQHDFPGQIAAVRGRGLMIGIELGDQSKSRSPLIRVLTAQDLVGFVVSGWFLKEENIRVAPTIASRATLRIEPSAYIKESQLDSFVRALRRLCEILKAADTEQLLRFTVRDNLSDTGKPVYCKGRAIPAKADPTEAKVAFLAHFLEPGDLRLWEHALSSFSDEECERFFDRTRGTLEPFVVASTRLDSIQGTSAHATVIAIPFTPKQVMESLRDGSGDWALDLIHQGVEQARRLGCSVVGFGGYTSIVTQNCRLVVPSDIAVTSGNSLTSAAALASMTKSAERLGLKKRTLGVVGAVGNIGRVLAEVAADDVDQILLVGSKRSQKRLQRAAADLSIKLVARAKLMDAPVGVAKALLATGESFESRDAVSLTLAKLGDGAPIRISTEMNSLKECNLVVTATNSASPVILPEHIKENEPVIICDVAVPTDIHPSVLTERPLAVCQRGGLVKAPLQQSVDVAAMRLPEGEIYGCLGETMLMGLAGIGENYSYGALDPLKVRSVRELARSHGFSMEENVMSAEES